MWRPPILSVSKEHSSCWNTVSTESWSYKSYGYIVMCFVTTENWLRGETGYIVSDSIMFNSNVLQDSLLWVRLAPGSVARRKEKSKTKHPRKRLKCKALFKGDYCLPPQYPNASGGSKKLEAHPGLLFCWEISQLGTLEWRSRVFPLISAALGKLQIRLCCLSAACFCSFTSVCHVLNRLVHFKPGVWLH